MIEFKEEDTYDKIREVFLTYEDGKYKDFIIEKDDINISYQFAIHAIDRPDKDETTMPIALCKNLGKDYERACLYLLEHTTHFPGLLRPDIKLIIEVAKFKKLVIVNNNNPYDTLYNYFDNKEDDKFLCRTLKYENNNFFFGNIGKAFDYYYGYENYRDKLNETNNVILTKLTGINKDETVI